GCFDFRPGLPLHLFLSEFVRPARYARTKFVGSVEQMQASRCFQKGTGQTRMGCTSCHDPHAVPAPRKKLSFYQGRCLQCHQDRGCTELPARRKQKGDDCVACHMPPTGSDVNHTTITDHRILRRPEPPAGAPPPSPVPAETPL